MLKTVPRFKFHIKSTASDYVGRIELKKETLLTIADFNEFYQYFGYNTDIAKKGILPEDYIWETFFKHSDRNCTSCYQLHILEYLLKHPDGLKPKFLHHCDSWIEVHSQARAACDVKKCSDRKAHK